jgi:hypothetical protein
MCKGDPDYVVSLIAKIGAAYIALRCGFPAPTRSHLIPS